jgi:hypothetical protein
MADNPFHVAEGYRNRATPMDIVIDPAAWYPSDVTARQTWRYVLSDEEIADVEAALASVDSKRLPITEITKRHFPLPKLSAGIERLRAQLQEGWGFVQVRGLPVERWTKAQAAVVFWGIGMHLGRALPQNGKGDLIGHVKDLGGNYADPETRGYLTNARMAFHADQCDYVALFCLKQAKSGGASRIASSVTVYNELLKHYPNLVPELLEPSYWTRHGEVGKGQQPWYELPVFNFERGYFSAKGVSAHVLKSQAIPAVPRYSPKRLEAFARYKETAQRVSVRIAVEPGDINILHNHVVLHSRDAFEDWPEPERKRHLYRLWINDEEHARPIPSVFRSHIQGIWVDGVKPHAEADVLEAAH